MTTGMLVEFGIRVIIVSLLAIFPDKLAVHGIAKCELQALQRSIKCSADGCVPSMKLESNFPITTSRHYVCNQTLGRERHLDRLKNVTPVIGS